MPRRPNEVPSDRFNVTLPRPVSQRLRALAEDNRQSGPATIAALVTSAVTQSEDDQVAEEARVRASPPYRELARQSEELRDALAETRRELAALRRTRPADLQRMPRWAWPLDLLLDDADWWKSWLPRLYELLGSEVGNFAGRHREGMDDRGYVDLVSFLFPPRGGVTWRSPDYGALASDQSAPALHIGGPTTAGAWDAVVRHVALALAALEAIEQQDADPFHAMRVRSEITGTWVGVLRHLLGESSPELQRLRSAAAR
jgi:hypothetical protein